MENDKMRYEKIYVSVNINVDEQGDIRPLSLSLPNGDRYEIDRLRYKTPAASLKVGGRGIRYTVVIGGREKYLFEENGRWFVEGKARE